MPMPVQSPWTRLDAATPERLYAPAGRQWPRLKLKAVSAMHHNPPGWYDEFDGLVSRQPVRTQVEAHLRYSPDPGNAWFRVPVPAELAEEVELILEEAEAAHERLVRSR